MKDIVLFIKEFSLRTPLETILLKDMNLVFEACFFGGNLDQAANTMARLQIH